MSSAKLTLIGFYGYDNTLFDDLDLPTGVEKDLLIDSILMRGGEYEVVYSNPNMLKSMIGSWSKRWKPVFSNWQRATLAMDKIRPLDNYDRNETWTDSGEHHDSSSSTNSDVMSGTGSTSGTDSTNASGNVTDTRNNNATNTVSAYDSNTLVDNTGSSTTDTLESYNSTSTSSTTGTTSNTSTESHATNSGASDGSNTSTHTGHVYGNVGVTTSATMYKEFYDVISKYGNIYESIATVFLQAFVIPIL